MYRPDTIGNLLYESATRLANAVINETRAEIGFDASVKIFAKLIAETMDKDLANPRVIETILKVDPRHEDMLTDKAYLGISSDDLFVHLVSIIDYIYMKPDNTEALIKKMFEMGRFNGASPVAI